VWLPAVSTVRVTGVLLKFSMIDVPSGGAPTQFDLF